MSPNWDLFNPFFPALPSDACDVVHAASDVLLHFPAPDLTPSPDLLPDTTGFAAATRATAAATSAQSACPRPRLAPASLLSLRR